MLSVVVAVVIAPVVAQEVAEPPTTKPSANGKPADREKTAKEVEAKPVVTHHEITVRGRPLKYTATAGKLPIRDSKGEPEAQIFFIAYTADDVGDRAKRPLMFSFNGGPGSSSVWLHLGALGPKRVTHPDDASIPGPPYRLVDNEFTWLDKTDLVFIDPVGTGYSRASKPELNKKFHGLSGDIASVAEFIRMYLTRYDRWASPLYLVGESYGTTRAAGLSDHLLGMGIALNGIALVSTVMDFQTLSFGTGNDLPYILFLPTYTATAWYHKKLPADLQSDLRKTLAEAEHWADTEYRAALNAGDQLTPAERKQVIERLARYTGLSPSFIDDHDLRIRQSAFCKELLRADRRTVGRLDSRYKGIDASAATPSPEFDPSEAAIRAPYTATFNDYVRTKLNYESDLTYHILGSDEMGPWDWGTRGMGYPETFRPLRTAMAKNPHMKIFVAAGYFDLATPYKAAEYTLDHMQLDPSLKKNVRVDFFEAGHMMYIHGPSLEELKRDITAFIDGSNGDG
jgi:carboxypeptidase C (cathepsin A)